MLADELAKKHGIGLIVSSPCFEIWCLCHFCKSSRHYSSNDAVIRDLTKRLPEYEKNGINLYCKLSSKTDEAISNAKALEKKCLDSGYTPHTVAFSPSTEIYKILEYLIEKGK